MSKTHTTVSIRPHPMTSLVFYFLQIPRAAPQSSPCMLKPCGKEVSNHIIKVSNETEKIQHSSPKTHGVVPGATLWNCY